MTQQRYLARVPSLSADPFRQWIAVYADTAEDAAASFAAQGYHGTITVARDSYPAHDRVIEF